MGIEQAFGFGREQEVVYVRQQADYRPYERRIAALEGKLAGTIEGYEKGIAELTAVAKRSKFLAERNGIISELFKDVLRDFVATGRMTRAEVNAVKDRLIQKLPVEDQRLISD